MSLTGGHLDAFLAAGLTAEQIVALVKADIEEREKETEKRRAKDRERQRRHRESRDVTVTDGDGCDPAPNDNNLTPTQSNPKPIGLAPKPKKQDRGSRLPNDWKLPDEWRQWAKERRGWSDSEITEEAELFANYWQARSGAGACHTDWFKTWRNWAIRSHRPDGKTKGSKAPTAQELRERAEWYVRHGRPDDAEDCRQRAIKLEQGIAA